MVVLQLAGQGGFILASFLLGLKLVGLWRRTGEMPELAIGLSFLLGGGLGFLSWFVLAIATLQGAGLQQLHGVSIFGLTMTCSGTLCLGVGQRQIYRPGAAWPWMLIGAVAVVMSVGWVGHLAGTPGVSKWFWLPIGATLPIYGWGVVEAFLLGRTLHKRARLGLADPAVVNRIVNWGIGGGCVTIMVSLSLLGRLAYGPLFPAALSAFNASLGLVAALAIWLGFFPPAAYLQRVARAYEGA